MAKNVRGFKSLQLTGEPPCANPLLRIEIAARGSPLACRSDQMNRCCHVEISIAGRDPHRDRVLWRVYGGAALAALAAEMLTRRISWPRDHEAAPASSLA